jgi:hypothetical protein
MRDAIIETIAAEIDAAYEEANLGCGLVYELFARRFQSACDALLAKVPEEHRDAALRLAIMRGYCTDDDAEEAFYEGACSLTGIEPDRCPCGRHE